MNKPPVALQLWSVRDQCHNDFAATVASVAKLGYSGVELAGYGQLDAAGVKKAVDATGMMIAGSHVGIKALRQDFDTVVGDALTLGINHLTCPWLPPALFASAAACESIGEELDRLGAALRVYGIQFSYHNHRAEMKTIKGRTVMDWILRAAQPRNLAMEPDVYWLCNGGQLPKDFLFRHGARCPLIHLKDEKELGSGMVNFQEIFAATDAIGAVEWYIVEQEEFSHERMVSLAKNLEQLRQWGR